MTQESAENPNLELVKRHIFELWQNGNMELAHDLFHTDFIDHNPSPGLPSGVAGILAMVNAIKVAFPNHRYELIKLFAVGDLVVDHWIFEGVHGGPLFGREATGRTIYFKGIDILRIADGKIIEFWHVEDLMHLFAQIDAA